MTVMIPDHCHTCPLSKPRAKGRRPVPLAKVTCKADIMYVGLSAKYTKDFDLVPPLGAATRSGKVMGVLESRHDALAFHKTNLVKCPPLNKHQKLRYPTREEMEHCFSHLEAEIAETKPKIILTLGSLVSAFFADRFSLEFQGLPPIGQYKIFRNATIHLLPVHHPSYISIYKRRFIDDYIAGISSFMSSLTPRAFLS